MLHRRRPIPPSPPCRIYGNPSQQLLSPSNDRERCASTLIPSLRNILHHSRSSTLKRFCSTLVQGSLVIYWQPLLCIGHILFKLPQRDSGQSASQVAHIGKLHFSTLEVATQYCAFVRGSCHGTTKHFLASSISSRTNETPQRRKNVVCAGLA